MATTMKAMSAQRGPRAVPVVLSEDERETLERWARRATSAQALALRCRVVLACAEGGTNVAIAARLGVDDSTVRKWRGRFAAQRLDGLHDEPRPGRPRTVSDADVERIIVKTLETKPKNATHWSTRSMAEAAGMSQTTVSRVWRAFGLKPHLVDSFKLSPDPQFIDKVHDIVGLYLNPPEAAVVMAQSEGLVDPGDAPSLCLRFAAPQTSRDRPGSARGWSEHHSGPDSSSSLVSREPPKILSSEADSAALAPLQVRAG